MQLKEPITHEGITYDKYKVALATVGELFDEKEVYKQSISLELIPMGRDENNKIVLLPEQKKVFRTFDVTKNAQEFQVAFYKIEAALQELIDKGKL